MILSIPHSSTFIPSEYLSMITIGYLEDEIRIMTDWHTDALFSYDNAERIAHPVSRLITGPERFRDGSDEPMALCGMGLSTPGPDAATGFSARGKAAGRKS